METAISLFMTFLGNKSPELALAFQNQYEAFKARGMVHDYSLPSLALFWTVVLSEFPMDTRHARMCLNTDTNVETWIKLFEKHTLPLIQAKWG